MTLQRNRVLSSLDPWLRIAMEWMEANVEYYGGDFVYVSGFRSTDDQRDLYRARRSNPRPVAYPTCSQHEYGYAVDIGFVAGGNPFGDRYQFGFPSQVKQFTEAMAKSLGLTFFESDPGHFQMYPTEEFKHWLNQFGICLPPRQYLFLNEVEDLFTPGFIPRFINP